MRGRALLVQGIAVVAGLSFGCGGSGGGASSPSAPAAPAAVTAPVAAPSPTATPAPTPTPSPAVKPVAKVVIKIEFIDCPATGEVNQAGPFNWTSVGCRIHLDLTAKDRYNRPTDGFSDPEWHLNDPSLVYVRDDGTHTPVLRAEQAGKLLIQGELDGVKSNTIQIWLY